MHYHVSNQECAGADTPAISGGEVPHLQDKTEAVEPGHQEGVLHLLPDWAGVVEQGTEQGCLIIQCRAVHPWVQSKAVGGTTSTAATGASTTCATPA